MRRIVRSEQVKLPRVHRVRRNGTLHKYHRVSRVKLPGHLPEDQPDFLAAWIEAEAESAPEPVAARHAAGTLGALCDAFTDSRLYAGLSKDYARSVARHVEAIRAAYGEAVWTAIRPHNISADLSRLPPVAARARRKAWRLLARHAGGTDPSASVRAPALPKSEGHAPWIPDEVAAYRRTWAIGSMERAAFELLYWSGARTIDAVSLAPAMIGADGILTYTQGKTTNPAHVPWTCRLPDWARPWEEDRDKLHEALKASKGATYLETAKGKPRTPKGLSNLLSRAARAAGVPKSAHGLRKSRLTLIAEAGGSTGAIMSWGGHVTLAEAQRYTSKAERKRLLIGREQGENPVNGL